MGAFSFLAFLFLRLCEDWKLRTLWNWTVIRYPFCRTAVMIRPCLLLWIKCGHFLRFYRCWRTLIYISWLVADLIWVWVTIFAELTFIEISHRLDLMYRFSLSLTSQNFLTFLDILSLLQRVALILLLCQILSILFRTLFRLRQQATLNFIFIQFCLKLFLLINERLWICNIVNIGSTSTILGFRGRFWRGWAHNHRTWSHRRKRVESCVSVVVNNVSSFWFSV